MHEDESALVRHESLTQEGTVVAQLPSGLYRVEIGSSVTVTTHIGGGLERNFVRLLVGERVVVELTARDRTRGRIIRKA